MAAQDDQAQVSPLRLTEAGGIVRRPARRSQDSAGASDHAHGPGAGLGAGTQPQVVGGVAAGADRGDGR